MKTIKLASLLLFIFYTLNSQNNEFLDLKSCPYSIGESIPVTSAEDGFNRAKLSPDGKKLLVTKHKYQGIYIIDLENKNSITKVTDEEKVGYKAKWKQNGEVIEYSSKKNNTKGERVLYDLKKKSIIPVNSNLKSITQKDEISVNFSLKRRMVEATDGENTWDITNEQGIYYRCIISPDKTKVLVHKNDGNMYVYSIDGTGLIAKLGTGICQSWTTDSNYIIYFVDKDDGYSIISSELYISSMDGNKKWQLTDTPDKIELWPHLATNGSKLTYYDLKSKKIYISSFNKRK